MFDPHGMVPSQITTRPFNPGNFKSPQRPGLQQNISSFVHNNTIKKVRMFYFVYFREILASSLLQKDKACKKKFSLFFTIFFYVYFLFETTAYYWNSPVPLFIFDSFPTVCLFGTLEYSQHISTCKIGWPIQPIWQQFFALPWSALKKTSKQLNFLHIFANPSSCSHEKRCQMLERVFVVFHHSRNIPCICKNSGCCCRS